MKNKYNNFVITALFYTLIFNLDSQAAEVFEYQKDSRLDHVFLKKGVDFSRYKSVMIDAISVWYPTKSKPSNENAPKAKANLAEAQELFRQMIADALADEYPVTEKPGKDVLRVHAEFVDLRSIAPGGIIPAEFSSKKFDVKAGHITLVAQLLDSRSGKVLARAADLGKYESSGGDGVVDWDAIKADFRYWAKTLRTWMDEVHGRTAPSM